jgi:hypothetical protein
MKRYALLVLIAAAGCSPSYTSGKTQCSSSKQCPSGYSCKDDGTSATHYCFDNKTLGCPSGSGFYCAQSQTCWVSPGACSTVTFCGTAKHPGNVICASSNYHADCNGDQCLPNGAVPDAGSGLGGIIGAGGTTGKGGAGGVTVIGTGGVTGKGGAGGVTVIGTGGVTAIPIGSGGATVIPIGSGGTLGTGGIRDAGPDGIGGIIGTGGLYLAGGITGRGGAIGSGGIIGTGGTTTGSSLCSGTPFACSINVYQSDCTYETGCVWDASSSTCSGTPAACSTYSSGTWCVYNGCDWAGALTCNATTMTSYCSSLIDSSTPTCTLCDYAECCGQITDCINDDTCWNNESGPLYQAWMDCFVGCCATICNGS